MKTILIIVYLASPDHFIQHSHQVLDMDTCVKQMKQVVRVEPELISVTCKKEVE